MELTINIVIIVKVSSPRTKIYGSATDLHTLVN